MKIDLGKLRFNYLGDYNAGTRYERNDVVRSGNQLYVYVFEYAFPGKPVTDTVYWSKLIDVSAADPYPLSTYRSNKDANGVYTVTEYKRADGTLFQRSTVSGGSTPNYTTRTVVRYGSDGVTVTGTTVFALSYDGSDVVSEVIVS